MILSEQKYTNTNKLYYRGLSEYNEKNKFCEEVYLSTRLIYSLAYSFGLKGVVEVYRLKKTANIFNMRSKQDEGKLRKFCQSQGMMKYLKYFEKLKNNDWLGVLGEDRIKLVNAIKLLGYDGYFNFEIDRDRYEKLRNNSFCNFSDLQVHSPSIAIFDVHKTCERVAVYSKKEDFEKEPEIKKIKQQELDYVNNFWKKTNEETFGVLRKRIVTLTNEELKETIKKVNKSVVVAKQKKYFDALRQRLKKRSVGEFV